MTWRILNFLQQEKTPVTEPKKEPKLCFCGSGKNYENCHEIEHAWPTHERPEPD